MPGFDLYCVGEERNVSVKILNTGSQNLEDLNFFYQVDGGTVIQETGPQLVLEPGEELQFVFNRNLQFPLGRTFQLAAWVEIPENDYPFDDRASVELIFGQRLNFDIDYLEDLETSPVPQGWHIVNPDEDDEWTVSDEGIGTDGELTNSFVFKGAELTEKGEDNS